MSKRGLLPLSFTLFCGGFCLVAFWFLFAAKHQQLVGAEESVPLLRDSIVI